jgi:hypothetical protein
LEFTVFCRHTAGAAAASAPFRPAPRHTAGGKNTMRLLQKPGGRPKQMKVWDIFIICAQPSQSPGVCSADFLSSIVKLLVK